MSADLVNGTTSGFEPAHVWSHYCHMDFYWRLLSAGVGRQHSDACKHIFEALHFSSASFCLSEACVFVFALSVCCSLHEEHIQLGSGCLSHHVCAQQALAFLAALCCLLYDLVLHCCVVV